MSSPEALRIGYVPEHFSTPLYFAQKYFSLQCTLTPFPAGTGAMITSLRAGEIDIGIGLTEGWIAGLAKSQQRQQQSGDKDDGGYKLVGTYVETPLCWAISTGSAANRKDVIEKGVEGLKGGKLGVSRIGSGSYVMGFVFADKMGWLTKKDPSTASVATSAEEAAKEAAPFDIVPLENFARLRNGVNDSTADFFMWEHFTSKRYYDNGEISRIGEIYTPWSSWKIVASTKTFPEREDGDLDPRLTKLFEALNHGVEYFNKHKDEAVQYISTELDYSHEDATEWLKTVKFADDARGVRDAVVSQTLDVLRKAGVVVGNVDQHQMLGVRRN